MKKRLNDVATYIQVAPFPHTSAVVFGASGIMLLWVTMRQWQCRHYARSMTSGCMTATCFGIALFAEADARSRLHEYRHIKRMFFRFGWEERIIAPLSASRCQRDSAKIAAIHAGYEQQIQDYFFGQGYRWYHIIPDAVLKDPRYIFSHRFFRSSFLVKKDRHHRR